MYLTLPLPTNKSENSGNTTKWLKVSSLCWYRANSKQTEKLPGTNI